MSLLPAIHHVALICSDYARSKAFYSETLGFRIVREVYRAERDSWKLDLEVSPGVSLELFSFPSPPPRPSRPEAQGLRHLAFAVPDIDTVIATLLERDVACEPVRVDEYTNRRFTFFADPDGLPIELYEQ
ncbi:VOC family protein [Dyella sp. EPa41]|uniref:SMU1112c/YaeR family gloxylase I-like metalloprotein n=1 Tax=Dyella sp. EPa41 TaxID=1561194 RepID=UPI0019153069|nr:VOC family protein [Dyella sp. EPa41]